MAVNLDFTGRYVAPKGSYVPLEFSRQSAGGWPDQPPGVVSVQAAFSAHYQQSNRHQSTRGEQWQSANSVDSTALDAWDAVARADNGALFRWDEAEQLIAKCDIQYQHGFRTSSLASSGWHVARQINSSVIGIYQSSSRMAESILSLHEQAVRASVAFVARWESGRAIYRSIASIISATRLTARDVVAVWQPGRLPLFIYPLPVDPADPPPPDSVRYIPPQGNAVNLNFICELEHHIGGVPLVFKHGGCVPHPHFLRAYIVINEAQLVRLPDRLPIPFTAITFGSDIDSWCWSFSANCASRAAVDALMPGVSGPIAIEADINGYTFTGVVESVTESRQFGKGSWTIKGRSQSAALAAPYHAARSYTDTTSKTAHQLASAELPIGWTLNWSSVDWLITPGAYTYRDATPISAIQQIASAIGASLQSHQSNAVLTVIPRYPGNPVDWAAAVPGVSINGSLVRSINMDWQQRPAYNGVYVSGTTQGVIALVRKTGTDGAIQAAMVTDSLITHQDAARERGRNILASCGRWAKVSLQMPLIPSPGQPGLCLPGTIIEVSDGIETWRGQVTGCQIHAARQSGMIASQTIEVERYYG